MKSQQAAQGTSAAYLLRRIARASERDPIAREVLAAYEAGEFASVAEAARAAGVKKPPKPEPPEAEARRILAKGDDYADAVVAAIAAARRQTIRPDRAHEETSWPLI